MSAQLMTWTGDTLVSMTFLMALVLILRKPVRKYFGPQIAYLLWCLPLARLFMPILTLEAPVPVTENLVNSSAGAEAAPVLVGALSNTGQAAAGAAAQTISFISSVDWMTVAIIIWLGGAGLMFVSKLAAYFQFREDIILDGQLVGRHENIKIVETAAVSGPLAFGLFDKYIAVPADFLRNYAPRERELALDHEIAHHEAGDLLANFVGLLVLSLHWFNPLAWLAWIAFRQDQETACDARILSNNGQDVRAIYGRTIAKSLTTQRLGLASPLGHKSKIKSRIKLLGQGEKSNLRKRLGMMMIGTSAVIALPLTATISYAEQTGPEVTVKPEGVRVQNAGTSVDVGNDGVYVTESTGGGYKYTVSNDRGKFEFKSERKLEKREIDEKLSRMVPSFTQSSWSKEPASPTQPEPPALHEGADEVINITMTNGSSDFANDKQYVHKIKHNGRTIILRTNKKLSKSEVREMVKEAKQSRKVAHQEALEHAQEGREYQREMRTEMREIEREVERATREAQREVEAAVREATRNTRNIRISADRTSSSSRQNHNHNHNYNSHDHNVAPVPPVPPMPPVSRISSSQNAQTISFAATTLSRNVRVSHCQKMGKAVQYDGRRGAMTEQTWETLVGCLGVPASGNDKRFLKLTLETLKSARTQFSNSCKDKSAKDKMKLKAYDREIEHLEHKLTTV